MPAEQTGPGRSTGPGDLSAPAVSRLSGSACFSFLICKMDLALAVLLPHDRLV